MPLPTFNRSSRNRLTPRQAERFGEKTLFARIARCVCQAGCLPRKELFETWEVARRVRRRFRGGRVVDLACGHGLLGQLLLILDDQSPSVLAVDRRLPPSAVRLAECLAAEWPRLSGRVTFLTADLATIPLGVDDLVVASHACGVLSDHILDRALAAGCRLALLPCCHDLAQSDQGELQGWLAGPVAVDVMRAVRLQMAGYQIATATIPADITPQNRLLLATPPPAGARGHATHSIL